MIWPSVLGVEPMLGRQSHLSNASLGLVLQTLTYLDLSNNGLDDDKVRMLASGLVENVSITHLNLAHNKIADRGVRALAKLLDSKSVISLLELQDNQIHAEGAKSLARALKTNEALISVNLR